MARGLQSSNFDRGEDLYREIATAEPVDAAALHYAGLLKHQRGDTEGAIDLLTRAIAADPAQPEYYNNFAVVLGKCNRFADALELFDEAIRLRCDYAEAHCNRACALERMKRLDEAVEGWRNAIKLKLCVRIFQPQMNACVRRSCV